LLTRIKAADYSQDATEAERWIGLARQSLGDAAPAEWVLAGANLRLSSSADFEGARALVERAKTKGLAASADQHDINGLLAETTQDALNAFSLAIQADSRHFPTQRVAQVCYFFLGRHAGAIQQSGVVRNPFSQ
jgi:hypothetical protein